MLGSDDWARYSTEDEKTFYYILGNKAWTADQEGEQKFRTQSVPLPRHVSPLREAEVHAQVAAIKPARHYVDRASERLEATGVDAAVITTFVDGVRGGDVNWAMLAGKFAFPPGSESLTAFCDLLRALAMETGFDPEPGTEAERRQELDVAVQKVYLQELSKLFESILRRAGSLVTLTFSDPQLNEASRCYLYGFFRAEKCLKDAIGLTDRDHVEYGPLVDEATRQGVLGHRDRIGIDPEYAEYSRDIFRRRNNVAHRGEEPPSEAAAELLSEAREVIEFVRGRRSY